MAVDYLVRRLLQTAVHGRDTFQLYQATALANADVSIARADPFYVATILTGFTTGSGTVTLTGQLSGATVTDVYSFAGSYRTLGVQSFTSITNIQTSGLTNEPIVGTVTLEAVSKTGQPKEERITVGTVRCRVMRARLGEIVEVTGGTALNSGIVHLCLQIDYNLKI